MSSSTLSNTNNTLAPLGAYLNDQPDRSSTTNETNFQTQYSNFASLMGTRPQFFDAFTDFTQSPSQWGSSASFAATSFAGSGNSFLAPGSGTIPVVGVPMATNAFGPFKQDPDSFYQQIISGSLDADYTGIVDGWANAGFKTAEFRIGYEFNGFMPWTPASNGSDNADFVAAWKHIANLIHSEGTKDGIAAKTIWDPATTNGSSYDVQTLYPGDQYVDVVSVDVYGGGTPNNLVDFATGGTTVDATYAVWATKPANVEHYYLYENFTLGNPTPALGATTASGYGWSFADTVAFAKEHNKPFGIDETGATSGQDDAVFPAWLASTIAGVKAEGVTVDHVDIWSNGTSTFDFVNGERPHEAAAWVAGFGAGSISPTGTTPTISLSAPGTVQEASVGAGVTVTETITTTNLTGNVYEEVLTSSGAVESSYKAVALLNHVATSSVFLAKSGDKIQVVDNPTLPTVTADSPPVTITAPPVTPPPIVTIGSGPDTLALQVSEDAWNGNALFTVSVDGKQIGGTQTATASHAAGQTQTFDALGTFAAGSHTATVNFLNDAYGGSPATDRNLYVTGATIDNSMVPAVTLSERVSGPQSFSFLTPGTSGGGTTGTTPTISLSAPGTVQEASVGAGVTVTETITTTNLTGNVYEEVLTSSGAVESSYKAVALLNHVATSSVFLAKSGDKIQVVDNPTLPTVTADSPPVTITAPPVTPPPIVTIGSGPDTLALQVSEDAWNGNALFTVSVDGKQIGGTQTATASHAAGQTQTFNELGTFAAGSHTATVNFLNDAYGGSPATDRNLYVTGATIDNSMVPAVTLSERVSGPQSFSFLTPGTSGPTGDTVSLNRPATLTAGIQTITGTESDPAQSIFLDWRTFGTPALGDSDWVQATVSSSGNFSASVTIDHPGTPSTMYYRIGSGPTVAAWSGTPS